MEFTKHTVHGITASHVDYKSGCEILLAKQLVCSIKLKLMKHNISSCQSPRESSGFKASVGQRVGRYSSTSRVIGLRYQQWRW